MFEARGKSFEEALENAAKAMFSSIARVEKLGEEKKVVFEEKASSLEELSSFVLSKALSEADASELFFKKMKVIEFKDTGKGFSIKCECLGQEMAPELGKTYVKGVTLHETRVEKSKKEWVIRMLLDI